ncbi:YopX family protein [Cohnella zeiphila]|uniref:YopX protein domain-containing protein n=1 Tax=Cohnella zeiphila TaxID=2761120 RepID=A0A7X0SKZ1_9BACL|nr:YopX family protein [Cohnella zeiphila]MBB6731908.1 hypothetical protein [Cohnella zeiphila]
MSREIKFRGRHIDTGEWVYGNLIGTDVIVGPIVEWDSEYFNTEYWVKVDPETVGQYTGLQDRNGKEIFEGDFVTLTKRDEEYVIQGNGYMDVGIENGWSVSGTVKFLHNSWFIEEDNEKGLPLDFEGKQALEIIGNIHENPELLSA